MKIFGKEITIKDKKSYVVNNRFFSNLMNGEYVLDSNTFYDLYKYNGDIRQCVRKIANSVSRNGLYLTDNKNNIIEDENITDEIASYFKAPTFLKFKTDFFRNYMVSGEVYIVPAINPLNEVIGFKILDSRSITKEIYQGKIINFKYNNGQGKQIVFDPNQIAFFKFEDDITNSNNGMGLLHSIVYDGLSDLEASKTNYALYQNQAIPSAILLLDSELSDDEMQIAKEQFEQQYKGSNNAHKTLLAGGIKDIKTLTLTPRDMEFINQRKMTTEKVSATFGVPKPILGYVDNVNYANGREQRKEFLEGTIRPYENDFEQILNKCMEMFMPEIWKKYRIKCDGEQLEETQERYEGQRADVERGILTINEVRIDRGLQPSNEPNCDKHITSRNAVLLEDIALDAVLSPNEE